jgi:lactate dehydrogenase-like 2-hydroxyacid dehydrogenase
VDRQAEGLGAARQRLADAAHRRRVGARIESDLEATYWESLDQMLARVDIVSVSRW